jgi:general secretion pathway protein J
MRARTVPLATPPGRRRHGGERARRPPPRQQGFTLVEVLVALTIMAVLAGLAWRGIDGMVRARDGSQQALERAARLNTILAQWQQDFAALHDSGVVPPLSFDGQTLRLTRTAGDGLSLVAWSLRSGVWQRWVSAPATRVQPLQEAWLRSQQLLGNEPGQVRLLDNVGEWQLYFYRGNAWSNAQSSGDIAAPPAAAASGAAAREALPDGVRLVIDIAGTKLTRDLLLAPNGS